MAARGAEGAASPLLIRLFGLFEVRLGSEPLPPLRTRRGLGLLALLTLHHGRPVDREWLAGTLWPSSPEPQALYNLRRSLSDLRRTLGAQAHRLQVTPHHSLSLELTGAEVDVVAFDAALARGDQPDLASAVALYRGPLLEGWADEWAVQERARREQSYLAALDQLAACATARSEHGTAARLLRQAIAADPFRETAQRALMEALAAGGDTAAAILVYRELRLHLHRGVNVEPSPETQALFERLRSDVRRRDLRGGLRPAGSAPVTVGSQPSGFAPAVAPGGNLPQPLSEFIGREKELLDVAACLSRARLVTLTGPGGIGKTRLAIRVAAECARAYADGAWFVDLAALSDPALVPQTVGRALRVPETPGRPLTETLQEALGTRQLLLVLDNCEHLIDACARLGDALLVGCPQLRVLATSRQPLGLTGETAWPVPPLSLPAPESAGHAPHPASGRSAGRDPEPWPIDALLESEAVRLFVDRALHAAPGFKLTPSSAPAALKICRRLDGIPLAIELAAARLKVLSIEQVAARLDDRFRLLTGGSRAALPRQQTLRATLDWSFDLLAEPERILLRRLSVFIGGFTLEAAEAVCADSVDGRWLMVDGSGQSDPSTINHQLSTHELLDLLTQLVDRSLVTVASQEGTVRYALLETTREYARDRLREAGEEEEQRVRHAQFFLALAERAGPELRGAAQAQWLQRLEEEHDNCRAAIEAFQARGAVEEGLRMGGVLGWFWWMRGYLWEGRERLQALLAQSGCEIRTSAPGKADRLPQPVREASHTDLHQPAVRLAQAKALNAAGMVADDQGDFEAAHTLFHESLALSRELGDQRGAAMALNNLGGQAQHDRDFPAARALYEESLAIWHDIGDEWWTAAVLTNLGRVALHSGEYATVPALVERALAIQRQLQDQRAIARSLTTLGTTVARLGDYEAAHALHAESLSIVRELGAKQAIEETLCTLGSIASERGDHDAALAFHEERLAIARDMGSTWGMAHSLYYLGLLARDRGEGCRAAALWSESLALSQRLGDGERIAECIEAFASLSSSPGQRPCGDDPSSGTAEDVRGSRRAARLLGAAAALRERIGTPVETRYRAEYEQHIDGVRTVLDEPAFAAAWAQGRTMTIDQAISLALSPPESP